jgi:addiction module HigA family antidote
MLPSEHKQLTAQYNSALPPIHPGKHLKEGFLEPLRMSIEDLAVAIDEPTETIVAVIQGRVAIKARLAFKLSRYFGTLVEMWLGMQMAYDVKKVMFDEGLMDSILEIEPCPRVNGVLHPHRV